MQYQEIQAFKGARVGRDVETLRSELAQIDNQITSFDREKTVRNAEWLELRKKRSDRWSEIFRTTPAPDQETQNFREMMWASEGPSLDRQIEAKQAEINATVDGKNWYLDQRELLMQLIAEAEQSTPSGRSGFDVVPPASQTTTTPLAATSGVQQRTTTTTSITDVKAPIPSAAPSPQGIGQATQQTATTTVAAASSTAPASGGKPVAAPSSTVAAAGSILGQQMKAKLAAQAVKESRRASEAATSAIEQAAKVTRPSKFAYGTLFFMALSFDLLNFFVDVLVVVDLILAVIFVLSVRAMLNRSVMAQRVLAACLIAFILFLFIPLIGPLLAFPVLCAVMIAGAWNPNASGAGFDRHKIQNAIDDINGTLSQARDLGKKLQSAKSAAGSVKSVSTVASKTPKTTLRLGLSAGAESFPFVAWLPLNVINTFWTFRDMRKNYQEALRLVEQFEHSQMDAAEATRAAIREESAQQLATIIQSSEPQPLDTQPRVGDNSGGAVPPGASQPQPPPTAAPRPMIRDVGPAPRTPSAVRSPAVPATAHAS